MLIIADNLRIYPRLGHQIWGANGKHKGKLFRDVPAGYYRWYSQNGPSEVWRDEATTWLTSLEAKRQYLRQEEDAGYDIQANIYKKGEE